ncbi:MAG: SpoIIE family protein phosphatase [Phycisphaerae bacterium]
MRLVVLANDSLITEVACGRDPTYIGSRDNCRVWLNDTRLGAPQAVVFAEGEDEWFVQQLHPEQAVSLNGAPLADRAPLHVGDELRINEFTIRVYPPQSEGATAAPTPGTSVAQLLRFAQSTLPAGAVVKKSDDPIYLPQQVLPRIGSLNLLLSTCITVEQFMNVALHHLPQNFAGQRAWIGVRRVNYGPMEYVEGRMTSGQTADLPEFADKLKPRVLDRGQYLLIPQWSAEERYSILAGPLAGPEAILGMLYVDTGDANRRFDAHDLDQFIAFANLFAIQLDAIFKQIAETRAATLAGEVSVAHEIQARLTPRKLPQWDSLQFGAFREPGRERTGDIYDVVKLANSQAAIMVSQTSASGALPSMLMSQTHAAFRVTAMHQSGPHVFLRSLNHLQYDGVGDRTVDCFMALIDPATGAIKYSIAGPLGAYIVGNRGEERRLGGPDAGPSVGANKSYAYNLLSEQLEPQETLVVFTRGVTTAGNRRNEVFGEERFINILCDGFGQLASKLLKEMLDDLRSFTEGGLQPDDITVLMAHRV